MIVDTTATSTHPGVAEDVLVHSAGAPTSSSPSVSANHPP